MKDSSFLSLLVITQMQQGEWETEIQMPFLINPGDANNREAQNMRWCGVTEESLWLQNRDQASRRLFSKVWGTPWFERQKPVWNNRNRVGKRQQKLPCNPATSVVPLFLGHSFKYLNSKNFSNNPYWTNINSFLLPSPTSYLHFWLTQLKFHDQLL